MRFVPFAEAAGEDISLLAIVERRMIALFALMAILDARTRRVVGYAICGPSIPI
jgi:hypothetical protein